MSFNVSLSIYDMDFPTYKFSDCDSLPLTVISCVPGCHLGVSFLGVSRTRLLTVFLSSLRLSILCAETSLSKVGSTIDLRDLGFSTYTTLV